MTTETKTWTTPIRVEGDDGNDSHGVEPDDEMQVQALAALNPAPGGPPVTVESFGRFGRDLPSLRFRALVDLVLTFDTGEPQAAVERFFIVNKPDVSSRVTHIWLKEARRVRVTCQLVDWDEGTDLLVAISLSRSATGLPAIGTGSGNAQASMQNAYDLDIRNLSEDVAVNDLLYAKVVATKIS